MLLNALIKLCLSRASSSGLFPPRFPCQGNPATPGGSEAVRRILGAAQRRSTSREVRGARSKCLFDDNDTRLASKLLADQPEYLGTDSPSDSVGPTSPQQLRLPR